MAAGPRGSTVRRRRTLCSFRGKVHEGRGIDYGPRVHICDECVGLRNMIRASKRSFSGLMGFPRTPLFCLYYLREKGRVTKPPGKAVGPSGFDCVGLRAARLSCEAVVRVPTIANVAIVSWRRRPKRPVLPALRLGRRRAGFVTGIRRRHPGRELARWRAAAVIGDGRACAGRCGSW